MADSSKSMPPKNPARALAIETTANPEFIQIDEDRITAVAEILADINYKVSLPTWDYSPAYPTEDLSFNEMFVYFLNVCALNFRFFHDVPGQGNVATFRDGDIFGAELLAMRLTENIDKIQDPAYLKSITIPDIVNDLLKAEIPIPDPAWRVEVLHQVGDFLEAHEGTDWHAFVSENFDSAIELGVYIRKAIPCFEDPFMKRAQLFPAMLIGRFWDTDELPKPLRNIDDYAVFADYVLPMVFVGTGIFEVEPKAFEIISSGKPVLSGSPLEMEIRASTIIAADKLLEELQQYETFAELNPLELDSALWLQLRRKELPATAWPDEAFVLPDYSDYHLTPDTMHY
jgi:hypothetical protein